MKIYRPEGPMLDGLRKLINTIPENMRNLCVEVGPASGECTVEFAKAFKKVHCVDIWPQKKYKNAFLERTKDLENVTWVKMPSVFAGNHFPSKTVNLVYIDANHMHLDRDLEAWEHTVIPGCFIGGHDYNEEKFQKLINDVDTRYSGQSISTFEDKSWLVQI